MKRDSTVPNQAANESKAEGERWSSDADTVERRDRTRSVDEQVAGQDEDDAGGITNRPLDEEIRNQDKLPGRGEAREGAHAGHGDRTRTPGTNEEV